MRLTYGCRSRMCLLTGCQKKSVEKLANFSIRLVMFLIPEFGSSRGIPIKILSIVNLDKPLLRGTYIKLNYEVCWVNFKYEQLAAFCYYCERIGHSDKMFQISREDLRKKELHECQYED